MVISFLFLPVLSIPVTVRVYSVQTLASSVGGEDDQNPMNFLSQRAGLKVGLIESGPFQTGSVSQAVTRCLSSGFRFTVQRLIGYPPGLTLTMGLRAANIQDGWLGIQRWQRVPHRQFSQSGKSCTIGE